MSCSKGSPNWFRITFGILLVIVTLIGNLLVIVSIVFVKVLRRPNNYFILSLAVADLLVGCLVLPLHIFVKENASHLSPRHIICYIWISGDLVCCSASVFSLTVISMDRYIAITHPLFYRVNATAKKISLVVIMTWISSCLITSVDWILPSVKHEEYSAQTGTYSVCANPQKPWFPILSFVGAFFLPLCITVSLYGKIWCVLGVQTAKNRARLKALQRKVIGIESPANVEAKEPSFSVIISEGYQERKGRIMMGIVIGVFIFCWLPMFPMWLINAIHQVSGKPLNIPQWVYDLLVSLAYFNSCANPLIYTMFNQDFRLAFKEILCLRISSLNSRIRSQAFTNQIGSNAMA